MNYKNYFLVHFYAFSCFYSILELLCAFYTNLIIILKLYRCLTCSIQIHNNYDNNMVLTFLMAPIYLFNIMYSI